MNRTVHLVVHRKKCWIRVNPVINQLIPSLTIICFSCLLNMVSCTDMVTLSLSMLLLSMRVMCWPNCDSLHSY